jgi:hypothetical protein
MLMQELFRIRQERISEQRHPRVCIWSIVLKGKTIFPQREEAGDLKTSRSRVEE